MQEFKKNNIEKILIRYFFNLWWKEEKKRDIENKIIKIFFKRLINFFCAVDTNFILNQNISR